MTRLASPLVLLLALSLSACDTATPSASAAGPLLSHSQTAPGPLDPTLGAGLPQTYSFDYSPAAGLDLLISTSEPPLRKHPSPIRAETVSGDTDEVTSVLYMEWNPNEGGYMMYGVWDATSPSASICGFTSPPPTAPASTHCVTGGVAPTGSPVLLGLAVPTDPGTATEKTGDDEPGRSYHRHPDGSISFDFRGDGNTTASLHLANSNGAIRDSFGDFLHTLDGTVYVNVQLDTSGDEQLPQTETLKLGFRHGTVVTFESPEG